jgi:Tol biopolymer transport system component
MKFKICLLSSFCLLLTISASSQTGSEVYLFDLKVKKGNFSVSNGKNITNHVGYDNQPSFHPLEPIVYFSSFNDEGRSDIKSYNYKTEVTRNITTTTEREYSPTVTPDQQFLSCIIQRDNNAQDLGKYPINGGTPVVLIDDLIVGYHAWINTVQLMLFVLGQPTNTLQFYDLKTKKGEVIEEKIGRSLHKIPNEETVSYVFKRADKDWVIRKFDPIAKATTDIVSTLEGSEDMCWTPDGKILMTKGSEIFSIDPASEKQWKPVSLEVPFAKGITRLSVSKDGKKIAVVVSE